MSLNSTQDAAYVAMAAVRDESDLCLLASLACYLARAHHGRVCLLTVTPSAAPPTWLKLPEACGDVPVDVVTRSDRDIAATILAEVRRCEPDVLILGWRGQLGQGRYLLGRTLDPVVQSAPCDLIVMRGECGDAVRRILIPAAGGPNAPEGLALARTLAPDAAITTLYVASADAGQAGLLAGEERLETMREGLPAADRAYVQSRVVAAPNPTRGILDEARQGYDLLILGAGRENVVGRFLFGDIPQAVLAGAPVPVMVVRGRLTDLGSFLRRVWAFVFGLTPKLTLQEQAEVYKSLRRGARPSTDFFVMITLAASIAALGLLLNSPAVIIGAMLVAPLMTAILGMGLSLVLGDVRFFWPAGATTLHGIALAVLTGAVLGLLMPGASVTQEMLNRGSPSLLDLGVALISGAAAAYALSRRDVSAALAGVAIAVALVPPLATVGICAMLLDWRTAGGALLLFFTNMVSIIAAGGLMFFMLGFRPEPGDPRVSGCCGGASAGCCCCWRW
jgi:uncharacterized hydrophobic protein (TIGR00271 family)